MWGAHQTFSAEFETKPLACGVVQGAGWSCAPCLIASWRLLLPWMIPCHLRSAMAADSLPFEWGALDYSLQSHGTWGGAPRGQRIDGGFVAHATPWAGANVGWNVTWALEWVIVSTQWDKYNSSTLPPFFNLSAITSAYRLLNLNCPSSVQPPKCLAPYTFLVYFPQVAFLFFFFVLLFSYVVSFL